VLRISFTRKEEAAGNNEPPSRTNGLQVRREAQDFRRGDVKADALITFSKQGKDCLSDDGRKSEKKLPALAAQLRAFSSLLSLPSQAQSVIKAFRRQGIGDADVVNTARFLLSRIESLSALLQVFQIFRGRAGRDCVFRVSLLPVVFPSIIHTGRPSPVLCSFRTPLLLTEDRHSSHRLAIPRISVGMFYCLVTVSACGGKTLISRLILIRPPSAAPYGLAPCGICRQFPHPLRGSENRRQTPQAKND